MYINYNPNPDGKRTDDCTIRALAKALGTDWETAYIKLAMQGGLRDHDNMEKNYVWGNVLLNNGFSRQSIPNTCPACYTLEEFAADHPVGLYVVGTGDHVVAVVDGDWFDTWDSGKVVPIVYYWRSRDVQ